MTESLDPRKGWECLSKALDEFEGEGLITNALQVKGAFCAVGAALHVAKVTEVDTVSIGDYSTYGRLYDKFERIFNIPAKEIFNINDEVSLKPKERLIYMRTFVKERAKGTYWTDAKTAAYAAVYRAKVEKDNV